jgi:transposase
MARGDLSDVAWERIAPYLPPEHSGKRGHPYNNHRNVINGILWIDRTGAPWRDLPERYGPWQTCYDRLVRWQQQGIWTRVLQALQAEEDAQSNVEWEGCALDSTSIKAHPHAAGARKAAAEKGGIKASQPSQQQRRRPPLQRLRIEKPSVIVAED